MGGFTLLHQQDTNCVHNRLQPITLWNDNGLNYFGMFMLTLCCELASVELSLLKDELEAKFSDVLFKPCDLKLLYRCLLVFICLSILFRRGNLTSSIYLDRMNARVYGQISVLVDLAFPISLMISKIHSWQGVSDADFKTVSICL